MVWARKRGIIQLLDSSHFTKREQITTISYFYNHRTPSVIMQLSKAGSFFASASATTFLLTSRIDSVGATLRGGGGSGLIANSTLVSSLAENVSILT